MTELTRERVEAAYASLATADPAKIREYWSDDLRFQMPGHHQFSGWFVGLPAYLDKLRKLHEACGGRLKPVTLNIFVDPTVGVSVDVYRLDGFRAGADESSTSPYDRLLIEGVHELHWENGKIVMGRSALFGDGVTQGDLWWSPIDGDGNRTVL